jgi:hypothetical protein
MAQRWGFKGGAGLFILGLGAASCTTVVESDGARSEGEAFFVRSVYPALVSAGCTACHAAAGGTSVFLTKDASVSYDLIRTTPTVYTSTVKSSIFTIGTEGKNHTGGPIPQKVMSAFGEWLNLEFPM